MLIFLYWVFFNLYELFINSCFSFSVFNIIYIGLIVLMWLHLNLAAVIIFIFYRAWLTSQRYLNIQIFKYLNINDISVNIQIL